MEPAKFMATVAKSRDQFEESGLRCLALEWLTTFLEKKNNTETQYEFVSQMDLGEGIALNEALRENLFMLLVSIMNQIPILLIGKPGCSKSLAMGVLQSNLNGEVSNKEFFKSMPSVEVFPYQCSPLSTPEAILNAFHSARQSNLGHKSTIVCVLLDEVGLAEESPHLPLKVLHRELEDLQGIACVGISNWALDAAKMSRCVTLYRPPPTVEDLCVTAEGIVNSANLKGYLRSLSEAFFEIYKTQRRKDFWGMREFYSTVRVINADLKLRAARGEEAILEPQVLMKTVQRNFGGQPAVELDQCIEEFFERVGMSFGEVPRYSTSDLIRQNLSEPDARHLMLLTKNNAALRLLFESGLLDHAKAEVMFGSTFPNDQSDVFVAMNLQRIKSFMQQPISLIMVHCDSLYESLYDLLNQHYMEYAGQRYVRIAHGSKAKQCPIHRLFRVIVITEIKEAYTKLAPPLLNRFEKQIFLRKDLMTRADEALLARLAKYWSQFLECVRDGESTDEFELPGGLAEREALAAAKESQTGAPNQSSNSGPACCPIPGYHPELLSSLVFTLRKRHGTQLSYDDLFEEGRRMLTSVMAPEAICIAAMRLGENQMARKFNFDFVNEYFHKQQHSDLPSYAQALVEDKNDWCDEFGAQTMVVTYSLVRGKVGGEVKKAIPSAEASEISLHELSSSTDIEKTVTEFYSSIPSDKTSGGKHRFLLIHTDPAATSLRMIEHCRFVCEKLRIEYVKRNPAETAFVILVVHLQRGAIGNFSFDFDSQWKFVFLDSVEPSVELNSMPSLGAMLNMPLIDVVKDLNLRELLKVSFRSSLSRLIYPHSRKPEDLQRQITQILTFLEDDAFNEMILTWILRVIETTPRHFSRPEEGTFGEDRNWFVGIAAAAHELALAGTFRVALHNRVTVLVTSLLTALLAHLDRNGCLCLLSMPAHRERWLSLATASLSSPLSMRLHNEGAAALAEDAAAQHEVGTDAQTGARPFQARFPSSWFVSNSIDGLRSIVASLPVSEQLNALAVQYKLSRLHEIGMDPVMPPELLDAYISDFTAMHLDWTERLDRDGQARIVKKTIERARGQKLTSVLELHQSFWRMEKQIAYCIGLLNAVPSAIQSAEKLIDTVPAESLNLDLLLLVQDTLAAEMVAPTGPDADATAESFYREWLQRKAIVSGLTEDFLCSFGEKDTEKLQRLKSSASPRVETLALMLYHVAYPLKLSREIVNNFVSDLPPGKIRHARTLLAILTLAQSILQVKDALTYCGAFLECWILDVCTKDAEATSDLEESCLRLFCYMSAGLPVVLEPKTANGVVAADMAGWSEEKDCGICTLPGNYRIPRSSCLNLALLRKLTVRSEGDARRLALRTVGELLRDVAIHEKHQDTTFATKYAVLCEEHATAAMQKLKGPSEWPTMSLNEVFQPGRESVPAKILQDVGRIRWMLQNYASVLCKEPIDLAVHDEMVEKLDPLLRTSEERLVAVCRTMRIYLLKCVERSRGSSFLRGMLAEAPMSETKWVLAWREMHDIDFEKFIGAALVPKWNPFRGADSTPEYNTAKAALLEMMSSTSTAKLDVFAKECRTHAEAQQRLDIVGLLTALCQEPGLHAALEVDDRRPPWRSILNAWLKKTDLLPVSDKERMLLRIFAGDDEPLRELPGQTMQALSGFSVKINPKMDVLLKWRWLGHYAGALLAAPPTSVLAFFRNLMMNPADLEKTFLPGMDEDIRNRVMKALLERGENIWKFKIHWYKCVCGYTFFIGECGRPMEVASCPACGAAIGGRDHGKTQNTTEDDETDRSPWGYMLPTASKDEKHISFRELPSTSARAVRLLLHGAMLCGLVANNPSLEQRVYKVIVNQESTCTLHQDPEAEYLAAHFNHDWQCLVENMNSNGEDLAASLHQLLHAMTAKGIDPPKSGAKGSSSLHHSWGKLSLEERSNFEETMESAYLSNFMKNYEDSLQELYTRWAGAEEDGKFVAELKEAADVRDFPTSKREAELPQLWAYRSPVNLDALHMRLGQLARANETLPVLTTVLQQPLYPVMRALSMLVGVFEWHALVITHFSGRITRTQASNLKVSEVLAGLTEEERTRWDQAFDQLEEAWRIAWPYVERFECTELTDNLKQVRMSRDLALIWTIPDSQGEGICPLALTQFLVERHNELVQVVSTSGKYPARKASSRLLSQHDVIHYDGDALMRFLKSRCVTYGIGGKLNFDFDQLESSLQRELNRPEITVELRAFQWLGENLGALSELRTVIKQRDLPKDVAERLQMELASATVAHGCLQKVQMSTAFILKSGGALSNEHAGEMLLSQYLRDVLSESAESLPSRTARSEVHLCHVDAFAKLLRQLINKDPMENVDPKYKAELPETLKAALLAARSRLPAALPEILGNVAEARLSESYIGANTSILDTLDATWEDLTEDREGLDALQKHFPRELQMQHWCAVYRLLR
eukprot:TRINITY_DN20620_c1_g3_i2.p1 TRINITY_DN20620_c1_g3~~TRINITY_DN20620_c1_g3_i2.p1  ORF type:complete len:2734 (+),score=683.56 TRINITY_DN20620_c1_g3_i2:907-8202(+)